MLIHPLAQRGVLIPLGNLVGVTCEEGTVPADRPDVVGLAIGVRFLSIVAEVLSQ